MVMNFEWNDITIDLKINSGLLGMQDIKSAHMLYPEQPVVMIDQIIYKSTIPGKNFRLYLLNTKKMIKAKVGFIVFRVIYFKFV